MKRDKIKFDNATYEIVKWDRKDRTVLLYGDYGKVTRIPMKYLLDTRLFKSMGIKWVHN